MFLSAADFFQNQLSKNSFKNTIRVSNGHDVGTDLATNTLALMIFLKEFFENIILGKKISW